VSKPGQPGSSLSPPWFRHARWRSLLNQRQVGWRSLLNQRQVGWGSLLNQRQVGWGSLLNQRQVGWRSLLNQRQVGWRSLLDQRQVGWGSLLDQWVRLLRRAHDRQHLGLREQLARQCGDVVEGHCLDPADHLVDGQQLVVDQLGLADARHA
jgi:hypothetical protein